jgi:hypothetical protein
MLAQVDNHQRQHSDRSPGVQALPTQIGDAQHGGVAQRVASIQITGQRPDHQTRVFNDVAGDDVGHPLFKKFLTLFVDYDTIELFMPKNYK